eukprot:m.245092 g.245092  ORF g.245092 m.245092 type:complete len:62 (-) comp15849_c0_seq8:2418-2603(-)
MLSRERATIARTETQKKDCASLYILKERPRVSLAGEFVVLGTAAIRSALQRRRLALALLVS